MRMSLLRIILWGNIPSAVSIHSSHILSSFNAREALVEALWLPVFDKEVTFHGSAFEASKQCPSSQLSLVAENSYSCKKICLFHYWGKENLLDSHSIYSCHNSQYFAPDSMKKSQLMQHSSPATDRYGLPRRSMLFLMQTPHWILSAHHPQGSSELLQLSCRRCLS